MTEASQARDRHDRFRGTRPGHGLTPPPPDTPALTVTTSPKPTPPPSIHPAPRDIERDTPQPPARETGQDGPRRRRSLLGVSETLLLALVARHLESSSADPLLDDSAATRMVESLDIDVERLGHAVRPVQQATALRCALVDRATRAFIDRVPEPTIVTLGVGLCTRYFRVATSRTQWFDIDLPNVAALRESLLPDEPDRRTIAASALDPRWMDEVAGRPTDSILFVIEGLLSYLLPDEVQALTIRLADRFPGSEILAEALGPHASRRSQYGRSLAGADTAIRWTIADFAEVTAWDSRIELLHQWCPGDHQPGQRRTHRLLHRLAGPSTDMKIGHLRLHRPLIFGT